MIHTDTLNESGFVERTLGTVSLSLKAACTDIYGFLSGHQDRAKGAVHVRLWFGQFSTKVKATTMNDIEHCSRSASASSSCVSDSSGVQEVV